MTLPALLCAAALLATNPAPAAEPAAPPPIPPASVTVADLAWLTGTWQGDVEGDFAEDQWSEPVGGVMMGMFRWVAGGREGKLALYEFLALEPSPEGPVLWLRHFGNRLVAREDKDGALAFHLASYRPGAATFDNRDPANPLLLSYRREGDDRLIATLERVENGKKVVTDFVYTRRR